MITLAGLASVQGIACENRGDRQLLRRFHKMVYRAGSPWMYSQWRGVPIMKTPPDLIMMAELVYRLRPGVIIETGTQTGGSALFWADLCELNQFGMVLSIDIQERPGLPQHHRIRYHVGSSVDDATLERCRLLCAESKAILVDLDSDHSKDHVLREMELYGPLVTKGSYLIVEDTNINGHPVAPEFGPGPWEAVREFLSKHPEFQQDRECERYGVTFHPGGWLRRIG